MVTRVKDQGKYYKTLERSLRILQYERASGRKIYGWCSRILNFTRSAVYEESVYICGVPSLQVQGRVLFQINKDQD